MNDLLLPAESEALRKTYLFAGLEDAQFAAITAHAHACKLDAGQPLFRQGDDAKAFFWVKEGLIRLSRMSPQGDEKVIELIGPGRYFAEAAIFMGHRYPVDATAQLPSRVIAIGSDHYKSWLGEDAERCFRLIGGMSARLHKLVNEIDRLTLMKGMDRLMQYLLDHSESDDEAGRLLVHLGAPKQVIASRIGVKPETLSRLLHKLADQGLILCEGNKVWILSEEGMTSALAKGIDD